ncbi:MAG: Cycloserine biosynthesis protein DcsG [Crocinitomicaceae bacterium]|nr:MAG: Cycloserine biosynthesis protein DcsG [Crocinitomicaceae bacterium]
MKEFDVVLLTDSRYVNPKKIDPYIQNVLKEDRLVMDGLEKLNLRTIKKDWNDTNFNWSSTKSAIFRSTWDYFDQFSNFRNWLELVKEQCYLINPYEQINWNLDKHYLLDLQKLDLPIVESVFVSKKTQLNLETISKSKNWKDIVIKPTISGAARHTYHLKNDEIKKFQDKWLSLTNNEDFMVQEFQKNILSTGEIAVMIFGGEYSHSVLKKAKKGDFRVQDDFGGSVEKINPSLEIIELAEKTVKSLKTMPIYARVDIIFDNDSNPVISELELIEPELWFRFKEESAYKLAEIVKDFLNKLNC